MLERVNLIHLGFVSGNFDSTRYNKIFLNTFWTPWKWIKLTFYHVIRFSLRNSVVDQSDPLNRSSKTLLHDLPLQIIKMDQNTLGYNFVNQSGICSNHVTHMHDHVIDKLFEFRFWSTFELYQKRDFVQFEKESKSKFKQFDQKFYFEKFGWIKSETTRICVTWLPPRNSKVDQKLDPLELYTIYGISYTVYAL